MYLRYLSIAILLIGSDVLAGEVVAVPSAWHNSHYGACYRLLETGMSDIYGPGFSQDENILQLRRQIGSPKFVIATDITSGTNAQKTVFEQRTSTEWCVVLTSPPVAALVSGTVSPTLRRPVTWTTVTQAPPGYQETKVLYKWNARQLIYTPVRCYRGEEGRWQKFNCNEAYQQ